MRSKSEFTWMDAAVLGVSLVFLYVLVLPPLRRAREVAVQSVCGTRMKGLGTAMGVYASSYDNAYPSIGSSQRYDGDAQAYSTIEDLVATGGECGLQHYWLLVYDGHCAGDQFSCPSDDDYRRSDYTDPDYRFGFSTWQAVSYAMQPATRHEANMAFPSAEGMDPNAVILGDKWAPGTEGKTLNHPVDGGNYLRYDYSVTFERFDEQADGSFRPTFGWDDNDVYHIDIDPNGDSAEPTRTGLPRHVNDSYLHWRPDRDQGGRR